MVLVMVFPANKWYIVKICMCHWWVSITGNTWRSDVNSFDPQFVHIRLPPNSRDSSYNGWNICCGWIDHLQCWYTKSRLYQMPQTEYWNSDFRSWIYIKTCPGDIQYIIFWCGFSCPIFGNNHCIWSNKDCGPDMMMPSSDSTSLWVFTSFDI